MSKLKKIFKHILDCKNPEFLGSGAQGTVIQCKDGKKKYAIKYAELSENKETSGNQTDLICTMQHELEIGLYLNNLKFNDSQNILFSKKYGKDNIVKYYPLKVAQLSPDVIDSALSQTKNNDENIERVKTGQDTGCYIVSEVCNEGGLDSFLKKPGNFEKFGVDYNNFADMIYQIFSGLVYFYNKGLYHWDMKPANIPSSP